MSSLNTLSAASEDRKSRLAALRSLKRKQPDDEAATPESTKQPHAAEAEAPVPKLQLSGRNYDPETRGPKLGFDQPPTELLDKPTLEEQAAVVEEEIRQQAAEEVREDKGLDLLKLQPKKPNWDLKRNLESRLEILNVRTDNAIARLVRERITGAQKTVSNSTVANQTETDGGAGGLDGIALVEGLRARQQEEEEEGRRERAEDEAVLT